MADHPGDGEYKGIQLSLSDSEGDEDRPRGNRRYDKLKGILKKDLMPEKEAEEDDQGEAIKDEESLADIRYLMMKRVGTPFVTNVLRVALNFKEERIAR
jgi:hypothetical protein